MASKYFNIRIEKLRQSGRKSHVN